MKEGSTFNNDLLRKAHGLYKKEDVILPESGTAAIHHLYQDLFITDLKKEVSLQSSEYTALRQ